LLDQQLHQARQLRCFNLQKAPSPRFVPKPVVFYVRLWSALCISSLALLTGSLCARQVASLCVTCFRVCDQPASRLGPCTNCHRYTVCSLLIWCLTRCDRLYSMCSIDRIFHTACCSKTAPGEEQAAAPASPWLCPDCVQHSHKCLSCNCVSRDGEAVPRHCSEPKCSRHFHVACTLQWADVKARYVPKLDKLTCSQVTIDLHPRCCNEPRGRVSPPYCTLGVVSYRMLAFSCAACLPRSALPSVRQGAALSAVPQGLPSQGTLIPCCSPACRGSC